MAESAGQNRVQFFKKSGVPVRQSDIGDIGLCRQAGDISAAHLLHLDSQQPTHLVNIVSYHSGKVVLPAQPVFLDLHFPAALNDRVSRQLAHI
jgi:hypothetical protein